MYCPQETEKDHLYNRFILLGMALCVVVTLAIMARQQGVVYAAMQWSTVEVTGTVTRLEDIPRSDMLKIIHYRYLDNDQKVHEGEGLDKRYGEHPTYDVGQEISLVYSRGFPGISSTTRDLHSYRPGFYVLTSGVLLALVFLGIGLKLLKRIFVLKRKDRCY